MRNKTFRKKKVIHGIIIFIVISVLFATAGPQQDNSQLITISTYAHLSIYIKPGPSFNFILHSLFFSLKRPATIACWLETANGKYVETIFASHNAMKGEWYGHPDGQPGALPVWSHKIADKKTDAITGATPRVGDNFVTNDKSVIPAGNYLVKFEVNNPYDYNDAFPKNLPKNDPHFSGDNGQPSLVYEGQLEIGKHSCSTSLKLIGAGAQNGQDGDIHGLSGITSALKIIEGIDARYQFYSQSGFTE